MFNGIVENAKARVLNAIARFLKKRNPSLRGIEEWGRIFIEECCLKGFNVTDFAKVRERIEGQDD